MQVEINGQVDKVPDNRNVVIDWWYITDFWWMGGGVLVDMHRMSDLVYQLSGHACLDN